MKNSTLFTIVLLIIGCGNNNSNLNSVKKNSSPTDIDVYEVSRRTGVEAYKEKRYDYALLCFTSVEKIAPSENDLKLWIQKCQQKLVPKEFVLIPTGTLTNYRDEWNNEQDRYIFRSFELDSFYICKYETIQNDYENIIGDNPSKFKGDSIPVHNITIFEAIVYCQRKSEIEGYDGFYEIQNNNAVLKKTGNGYRLPTEYEWAFAARDGEKRTKYAAGDVLGDIAWYGRNSNDKPHDIGLKMPNGRGIYDMCGNASELCHTKENEVWPKGGSYEEWPYDDRVFHEDDARGIAGGKMNKRDLYAGIRLVFIPKNIKIQRNLNVIVKD